MRKRILRVLAILASVTFVVGASYFIVTKWDEASAEAKSRCADPAVQKSRTIERCVSDMMLYYHLYSRLPKVGVVVSAQQQSQGHEATAQTSANGTTDSRYPVVNLPGGHRFVSLGPELGGTQTYITEPRPTDVPPRRLSILRPGGSPLSWDTYIYIQEH